MSNPYKSMQYKQPVPNTEQNPATPAFTPSNPKAIPSTQTPSFLSSIVSRPWNSRNLQLRNFSVQDREKCKNSKQWKTPTESTISPESSSTNSTSAQDAIENQNQNFWPTLAESEASPKRYQPNSSSVKDIIENQDFNFWPTLAESEASPKCSKPSSASVQDTIKNQNLNFRLALAKSAVSPKCSKPSSASVQDTTKEQNLNFRLALAKSAVSPKCSKPSSASVQNTTKEQNLNFRLALAKSAVSPKCSKPSSASVQGTTKEQNSKSWTNHSTAKVTRYSTKTPQRNSYTDRAVDTLIKEVNNLYYSHNKDINRLITYAFNNFKIHASYLTDDHRKQLLSIMPTIGEIIDKKNLDQISTITILYSLAKTEVFCEMNPNNTSENEYIRYEQESINLIDKILTKKPKTHKKHSEWNWNNIFYALGLLAEQSPNLITSEQINKLMVNLNIQKQSLTEFKPQEISNMFAAIVKLLKFNKLDSSSSATHSFLTYLLQQIKPAIGDFNTQAIASTLLSIDKLARFPDFIQFISDKQDIIELLLNATITNKNLDWKPRHVSQVIYTLGIIIDDIPLNKKFANIVKEAYHTLYSKVFFIAPKFDILSASFLLCGIIKLIKNNIITSNKPSKRFIIDVFLEKIIADTSIINNNRLYHYLNTMANFQAYLTKNELIKILENINFFIPDINDAKSYFTAMGYLLAKIRKEIANDNKNSKLIVLEHLIETEIKKAWLHFKPNIDSFNIDLITAIHNTCSLIYKAEDLTLLKATYAITQGSNFEESSLAIIKTLIPDSENLKIEYRVNSNLPPVDACIIQPDGSILAIEIQGNGHYLDDEGEYPSGKHLLKSARLQIENIQVIEVNGGKLMSYNNLKYLAPHLINILLENNVKIRPEYCNNIPKLVRDAGFTSK